MVDFMNGIREMIRNLAAFFVLSTLLLRLLPGGSYTRYLRFFLGLILVILLLRPVSSALSAEDLFTDALSLSADVSGGDTSELKNSIAAASAVGWETLLLTYQGEIQEQIDEQIDDLGVCVSSISVESRGAGAGNGKSGTAGSGSANSAGDASEEIEEVLIIVIAKTEDGGSENRENKETSTAEGRVTSGSAAGNAPEGDDAGGSEESDEGSGISVGEIRIEIPVISVFADAASGGQGGSASQSESGIETGQSGDAGESEADTFTGQPESVSNAGSETAGTQFTDEEIAALVQVRIAEFCGVDSACVEVLWE